MLDEKTPSAHFLDVRDLEVYYTSGGETAAGLMRLVTRGQANLGIVAGVSTLLGHVQRLEGFVHHLKESRHFFSLLLLIH